MNYYKELSATGKYGTVTAKIYVTMNYLYKRVRGTNAITHDDYEKDVQLHKIESFVNGSIWKTKEQLESEGAVLSETEAMINDTLGYIISLSNQEPSISFDDKMKEILK